MWHDNDHDHEITMKNIYLTIDQQIAKYSIKLLVLYVINWSGDYH